MDRQPRSVLVSALPTPETHHVELFGVPRLLVGQRLVAVTASGATLADLAFDLLQSWPVLGGQVLDQATGWPLEGYSFVVDERFTRDRHSPIQPTMSVLLVASAAGG
jgi:hypothetical protein